METPFHQITSPNTPRALSRFSNKSSDWNLWRMDTPACIPHTFLATTVIWLDHPSSIHSQQGMLHTNNAYCRASLWFVDLIPELHFPPSSPQCNVVHAALVDISPPPGNLHNAPLRALGQRRKTI